MIAGVKSFLVTAFPFALFGALVALQPSCGSDTAAEDDGSSGSLPDPTRRDGGSSGVDGSVLTPDDGGTGDGAAPTTFGKALRFQGNGTLDQDRVKIRIDQPGQASGTWPMDVGATDFTIEFWMKAAASDNKAPAITCGAGADWILGNILIDRDRYNKPRKFGVSISAGKLAFGVTGENGSFDWTLCGTKAVLDDAWHHVAVERRRTDGHLWIFVDGALDAEVDGPDGDVSYPDGEQPGNQCNGPCTNSDPFFVIGAEKHDTDPQTYLSYKGTFDELRVSKALRYTAAFKRPSAPFATDANTVGLYHFDEGTGTSAADTSGAQGGPSPAELKVGGSPVGPTWVAGQ